MGAEIWYDETYDSGVVGCPGARFVINLNVPPLDLDDHDFCPPDGKREPGRDAYDTNITATRCRTRT
jgi:hypothetical protein